MRQLLVYASWFCVICHLLIDYSILVFIGGVELHQSTPTTVLLIVLPGANIPERATPMSLCNDIFTDKLFLERFWCELEYLLESHKPVNKNYRPEKVFFTF